ncbi:hypothetical protein B5K05_07575 [Rhizobium phaseoli]|nr:hypothetical protein B5K04_07535 [Rhizobium phaseoli]RDJ17598.1 hypothetical protein B5K05_07575 [Rhizobium phaseoli]
MAAVASPVLRGFALWATRLRMRLERGRAVPRAPHPAAATFSPHAGRRGQAATSRSLTNVAQGTSPRPVFTGRGLG